MSEVGFNYEDDNDNDDNFLSQSSGISKMFDKISIGYRRFIDRFVKYRFLRWTFFLLCFAFFCFRVMYYKGWYVIAYCVGIFYLTQTLLFISPKNDPEDSLESYQYDDDDSETLPLYNNDDKGEGFTPFVRRIPEVQYWNNLTFATLISIFCSFFRAFDIPVFVPVLIFYFIILSFFQFRKKIRHMVKFKYVPWTRGKKKFGGK